jgi:hypothetical protein
MLQGLNVKMDGKDEMYEHKPVCEVCGERERVVLIGIGRGRHSSWKHSVVRCAMRCAAGMSTISAACIRKSMPYACA